VGIPEFLPFEQQEYFLTKTFVAVPDEAPTHPGARRRTRSSPPSFSVPVTVMLRNLPNRAKSAKVLEHVKDLGFPSFKLHVPIDCRSGVNKGYCFVQLPSMELAAKFCSAVDQTQLPASGSTKKLHAMFACDQRCRFTWKEVRVVRKEGQTEVHVHVK
jgi:RNA recognition motif-containing protein